jgi:DNA polymerase III subunit epsilon
MTGLDATRDRVVEICIERVRGNELVGRLHTLVRPENIVLSTSDVISATEPPEEVGNAHVHGIQASALAGAPTFAAIADRTLELLRDAVLIAHGAAWDVAFLSAELARNERPVHLGHWLDTLNLSRRTFALPRHSLDFLRDHFGLDRSRAHRADADVAALREVFVRCVAVLEPRTPRDLWEVRIAEGHAREQIVEACRAAVARRAPVTVVYRPRARAPESLRMVLLDVLDRNEPVRIVGYQLPGRGRRELRADRILRIEDEEP